MNNILKDRLEARQLVQAEHPSADTLVAFVEHSLRAAPRDHVLAHLAVCPACRQAVALATPESAEIATASGRAPWFRFSVAMRWASAAAALAVAVGVGMLLHEHPSTPRPIATTSPADQLSAPALAQSAPENLEAKSQPKNEATERKTLTASVSKKHQNGPLHVLGSKTGNDMSLRAGVAGGVMGGLASAKAAHAVPGSNANVNGFVSSREERADDVLAKNQAVTNPAPVATPAPPQAGAAGVLQAFDKKTVAAPEENEVISSNQAQPLPPEAAPMVSQAVDVAAESEPSVAAKAQKRPSAVAIGGPLNGQTDVSHATLANWAISDEGQLQRTLRNGAAASVAPEPGVTVEAVAAEGIEVWAAGLPPDAASRHPILPVLFHSSDAGKTWTKIEGPWKSQIVRLSLALGNLTVVAKDGIWSTLNAGKSWLKR